MQDSGVKREDEKSGDLSLDDDKTDADIDKTTEKEFLRVDWRMHKGNVWFHVSKDLEYY